MIDNAFAIERDVAAALTKVGIQAVPASSAFGVLEPQLAMSQADTEIVASLIDERDMYQALGLAHQAAMAVKNERIAQLERERSILATRCYEQARCIEKMLARREPEAKPAEPHPIITAVEAMQRGGLR